VGATLNPPVAVADALLNCWPAVDPTVTSKVSDVLAPPGTGNDPFQVRVWPETEGLAVVVPVVDPATYEKPAGSVSVIDDRVTGPALGLLTVIV
jgi:hypothetical protein